MKALTDSHQRHCALNIDQSFIVQAPAGSGKTELLVQRAIKCLLSVENTNHVLILTFTNKASKEINHRLKSYIFDIDQRHLRQPETQLLLKQLDNHIIRNNWNKQNESTFNICKTFDAFTYQLADLDINLVTHTDLFYEKIVESIFHQDDFNFIKDELHEILTFIDYDYEKLKPLLIDLIKTRDQWLSPLLDKTQSPELNYTCFLTFLIKRIHEHANESFKALVQITSSELSLYGNDFSIWSLDEWAIFIDTFLTKKGTWRKRYTNPHLDKELKLAINDVLSSQNVTLADIIFKLYHLPKQLPKKNLFILEKLQTLLPKVCAILDLHMQSLQQCDFTYLTIKAIEQLRSEKLSSTNQYAFQIQHILIDEFQDTSNLQAILIESLILIWHDLQQKSVFIVGDPMQSIYKFRQADVRLFKRVQSTGIGNMKLASLALSTNFRSSGCLIKHFNQTFKYIFPEKDDLPLGGITYHPSTAMNDSNGQVNWLDIESNEEIVNYINAVPANESVAVLARSRSHLLPVYQGLTTEVNTPGLFFLYEYPWIQEIASILIAIYAPDSISTIAIQRLQILNKSWENIFKAHIFDSEKMLSQAIEDAKHKISHSYPSQLLLPIVKAFLPNHYHHEISLFFYEQIDIMHEEAISINRTSIQHILSHLRPEASPSKNSNIHLMTIHQSKGLEFDHVIIPSIHSRSVYDSDKLIHWFQYDPNEPMMIGNFQDQSETIDVINQVLRGLNHQSNIYEMQRLLYVAATRAKKRLIYVGLSDKKTLSFAALLKKSELEPSKDYIIKKPINQTTKLDDINIINHIQPIEYSQDNFFKASQSNTASEFGTAIHHVIECFINLNIPLKDICDNSTLMNLCLYYDKQFKHSQFTQLLSKLQNSKCADWLFFNCEEKWSELALYGTDNKKIIIDYIFRKNSQVFIVDFKTNTLTPDQYIDQLSLYEHAVASYLSCHIEASLIYNPLNDQIFDKFGKEFHLEMIMC
ncbi:MAG: UvrD-helicase domain-containing protein [Pseudomonadota bacterium]|nr:UvrD-helicase domain-containing protein [Pseudomonadota bacterium]